MNKCRHPHFVTVAGGWEVDSYRCKECGVVISQDEYIELAKKRKWIFTGGNIIEERPRSWLRKQLARVWNWFFEWEN